MHPENRFRLYIGLLSILSAAAFVSMGIFLPKYISPTMFVIVIALFSPILVFLLVYAASIVDKYIEKYKKRKLENSFSDKGSFVYSEIQLCGTSCPYCGRSCQRKAMHETRHKCNQPHTW